MRFVRKPIEERPCPARAGFVQHPLCWCVFIANLLGAGLPAADNTATVRPSPPKADSGELVHHYSASLVFIEERGGAGSAFVCRTKDGLFLFTNQHVVAGMVAPRFTRLDGALIKTGAISGAIGHDLIRFALSEADRPMPASDNVEAEARIGDEIIVLGNPEGARVIQPLTGKLAGIGPDRIEVTAEFLPGNSGSPILHLKSGKVIGVATYIMRGEFGALTDAREARIRRFGYRLDSAKEWQPITWSVYQAEKVEIEKIDRLTRDLIRLIDDIADDTRIDTSAHSNPVLARPVRELSSSLSNRTLSTIDRSRAVKNFLATLRAITQSDVTQARGKLRYDFFRRDLIEQTRMRDRIFQLFDRSLKSDR